MGGWPAGPLCIIMPLCGPTCKFARFQAELKFPSWTECGNEFGFKDTFIKIIESQYLFPKFKADSTLTVNTSGPLGGSTNL